MCLKNKLFVLTLTNCSSSDEEEDKPAKPDAHRDFYPDNLSSNSGVGSKDSRSWSDQKLKTDSPWLKKDSSASYWKKASGLASESGNKQSNVDDLLGLGSDNSGQESNCDSKKKTNSSSRASFDRASTSTLRSFDQDNDEDSRYKKYNVDDSEDER